MSREIAPLPGKSSTHFLERTPGKASKLSGTDQPQPVIVNSWRNGNSISSLLNNDSGMAVSSLPAPTVEDLPITTEPPTHDEVVEAVAAMRTNKAAALDCAIRRRLFSAS